MALRPEGKEEVICPGCHRVVGAAYPSAFSARVRQRVSLLQALAVVDGLKVVGWKHRPYAASMPDGVPAGAYPQCSELRCKRPRFASCFH